MADILYLTPNLTLSVKHEINGTMILGSLLLADGFDVSVLRYTEIESFNEDYYPFLENFVSEILARNPKSVVFYSMWTEYHIILRLCQILKQRNSSIYLILAGPQASALAQYTIEAFPAVDFICAGEGENTVVPFFRRLLRNDGVAFSDIPGLYHRENGQIFCNSTPVPFADLNALPFWDDRLLLKEYTSDIEKRDPYHYYMPLEVGRGCPFNCTFCCLCNYWRHSYRLKSPERILKDIRYFHDKFGYKSFMLSHDALTANQKLTAELCDKIIESGLDINWECTTRVDCLTPELIMKMKQSGLKIIHMGIETGSERMQKLTNKNLDLSKAKETVKLLLSLNMRIVLFFVYAIPEETEEDLNKTLELIFDMCDLGVPNIQLITCMFMPGSELTRRHYDQLIFDPALQPVAMSHFGCREEIDMIRQHKPLFSTLYYLPGTIGDKYPLAKYLSLLYQKFPKTSRYIRHFYHGDYLKLYRDFHENNPELVSMDIPDLEKALDENPLQIMLNTLKNIDAPNIEQARELLRFETDIAKIKASADGTIWNETYGFLYFDYLKGRPIAQYTAGSSKLLIRKEGKLSISLVGVQ